MSISRNRLDRQFQSHRENPLDNGDDRRVADLEAHSKLDEIRDAILDNDPDGEMLNYYGIAVAVPASVFTSVSSYTVPIGKEFYLQFIHVLGDNVATYTIQNGAIVIARSRTYFGTNLEAEIKFTQTKEKGLKFTAGETIQVFVEHERPYVGQFDSRIIGILKDA